jgi:S1-C subfamily serine protease
MRLRAWKRPRAGRRSLGLIVGCAVAGGWVAGIVFWVLVFPAMLDLGEAGLRRLESGTSDSGTDETTGGGTGFVVSPAGHVLTNYHVIRDDCGSVTARIDGEDHLLGVLASDPANDLAILKLPAVAAHAASFRDRDVRLGESVVVGGFPLQDKLSSTIHVTTGLVSNLAGMYDNTSSFQVSAPIQMGNSGSPVLDQAGNVLGVLVGTLDAESMLEEAGDVPQNVNFAIKASVVRSFLEANSVQFQLAESTVKRETEQIAADASRYTLPLTCRETNAH